MDDNKVIWIFNTKRPNKKAIQTSMKGFALLKQTSKGRYWEILTDVAPIGPQIIEIKKPEVGQKIVVPPIKKEEKKEVAKKTTSKKKQSHSKVK